MIFSQKISLYNGVKDNKGKAIEGATVLAAIKEPAHKLHSKFVQELTKQLRSLKDKAKQDELKKTFPGVTWSGEFKKRDSKDLENNLIHYSGYICLDIDKLEAAELKMVRKRLVNDPYTCVLFISPSGNGLKVLFWHEQGPFKHLEVFLQMQEHIESMYGIKVDQSGKDICRLCFIPHDAEIFITQTRNAFPYVQPTDTDLPKQKNKPALPVPDNNKAARQAGNSKKDTGSRIQAEGLAWVKECTEKKHTYTEGQRNDYVHFFSCVANREGIPETETLSHLLSFASDLKGDEVKASVKSAYKQNASEHGSSKASRSNNTHAANGSGNEKKPQTTNHKPETKNIPFFWVWEEDEKGRKKLKLLYNELIDFLAYHGFHRMPTSDSQYQFIHFHQNVVKPVTTLDMKDFVFDYLQANSERDVLEMCRRGSKNYFTLSILDGLPKKPVQLKRDAETESYNYFKNGIVKVTAEGIEHLQFQKLDGTIWQSKVIDHELKLLTAAEFITIKDETKEFISPCHFAKFIWHCSHNDNDASVTLTWEQRLQRFMAHVTSIGYLLHEHKNPTLTKAIIGVDNSVSDKGEQDGGTGKSLFGKALSKFRKTSIIPGKEFKEDYPFKYEMVTIDSKILFFNDVRRNFDFESIFELLTDDFTFNRRNIGFLTIPFEDSPKLYIASNHTLKGQGKSFKRRQHIIEFSDFFNEDNKPHDFFGHTFFSGWDAEQWNLFYNFLIWCIQCFLRDGLVDFPNGNYEQNKLINESTTEFLDFMDEVERNKRIDKAELFDKYKEIHKQATGYNFAAASFYKWTKRYADNRGLNLNGHVGKYDKAGGKEYYCIWEPEILDKYKAVALDLKAKGRSWSKSLLADIHEGKMF